MSSYFFKNLRYSHIRYNYEKINDILFNYKIVNINQTINPIKIKSIKNNVLVEFCPVNPIYMGQLKKENYILDGFHRLEVYKELNYLHEVCIPVINIECIDEYELKNYYKIINFQSNLS